VNERGLRPRSCGFFLEGQEKVARVSPGAFLNQVKTETAKIVWPTRRETLMTALMVVIMTALLAVFFFGVDTAFSSIVQALLGLLS
jgi:preprotein translocase subunit SecE